MKTYYQIVNGTHYTYFWDFHIKSWTVYESDVNNDGDQLSDAQYFANKTSLLSSYPFNFKTDNLCN